MLQKIIQVGNSLALTIPKNFIDETGFSAGDQVFVKTDPANKTIVVTSKDRAKQVKLKPDLFNWLDKIEEEYGDVIKELANK